MKTIKFSINVKANDSYIYAGHLFLILKSGKIVYTQISKFITKLVNNYPDFENLIRISFQRNDYIENKQGLTIFGIKELSNVFSELWERATNEIQFIVEFDEDDFEFISEIPSLPVLDMKLYAMRMYLGCKEGLFEINLNPSENNYHLKPSKPDRRFPAKVTHLNAKSGEIVISANSEGLFHGSFLNNQNKLIVNKTPIASKSIRTGWSGLDVINYEKQNNFEYYVNETIALMQKPIYSKFDEHSERRRITEFGKSKYEMSQLLEDSKLDAEDIVYCFNSSFSSFFYTKDGRFLNKNLIKDNKENFHFSSRTFLLPDLENYKNEFNRPISSSILLKGCVVEYYSKVVLYRNSIAKIIETVPCINVRTYPSSFRYKNLISVTKENEVSVHSIYPFEENLVN